MEGSEHEIVECLDELTGVVNEGRLIEHEAVDATREEGGGHTVTRDVTDANNDMLLVLEVHRRIIAPDADRRSKITDDLDVPAPLVGRNHAPVNELGDVQVPFKTFSTRARRHCHARFVQISCCVIGLPV